MITNVPMILFYGFDWEGNLNPVQIFTFLASISLTPMDLSEIYDRMPVKKKYYFMFKGIICSDGQNNFVA